MKKRKVVIIMTDSMRVDHLGCYGNNWIKTPNIDSFASESVIFDHAYSEGLPTLPARTALFTGRYTLPYRGWQRLNHDDVLLSEILYNKHVYSAMMSDTMPMHEPLYNNYERGFDYVQWIRGQWYDPYVTDVDVAAIAQNCYPVWEYSNFEKNAFPKYEQYLKNTAGWKNNDDTFVAQVIKAGIAWLNQHYAEPFLLWLDCFDPHSPYDPRFPPYDKMYDTGWKGKRILFARTVPDISEKENFVRQIRANYAGEVSLVDEYVGKLLEAVKNLGLYDETLIILLSDHGEPLGDHGFITKVKPWPYEELSHIPLIVRLPEKEKKGRKIESFMQTCDVMPTILDFLGINIPSNVQGKSLMPLIYGEDSGRDFAISGYYNTSWSIRNKEHSFYIWLNPAVASKTQKELYRITCFIKSPKPENFKLDLNNYSVDAFEKNNVINQEHEVSETMERTLRNFMNTLIFQRTPYRLLNAIYF